MDNPIKIDDLGVPAFMETPYIYIYTVYTLYIYIYMEIWWNMIIMLVFIRFLHQWKVVVFGTTMRVVASEDEPQ